MPKQLALGLPTPLKTILPTVGDIAAIYLGKSTGDTKYGIYTKGDKFYIGNKN